MTGRRHLVLASDLDRTLIYSRAATAENAGTTAGAVAVERYRDADASWMTRPAATALAALATRAAAPGTGLTFVPVTTRTPEQYSRVRLPGPAPRFAVTANGGVLLVDGRPDDAWSASVRIAAATGAGLGEIEAWARAACHPDWTSSIRLAADLFCYAVLDRARLPTGFVHEATQWAAERGWRVSLQGRKLYWVPRGVSKSAAVAEIAGRTGGTEIAAAGDSLLDADLLDAADAGIVARHGELVASGWRAPHVVVTAAAGILAGEEIVTWFGDRAGNGG